jgi:alkylated DNA nucleotide flippase Atl1
LTPQWRRELAADIGDDETLEDVHEELLHTLGNLTLTGYNSEMSNRPFTEKREQLGKSGIELSRYIADQSAWGRPQILARADDLAGRIIENWIAPIAVRDQITTDARWSLVDQAIDCVPSGSWTTYGALAAIAGSHPVPVGQYVASRNRGSAWRVLKGDGSVAAGFRWSDDSPFAGMNAREVLEREGVTFTDGGHADPATRISAAELADRLGLELAISDEKALDDERGDVFEAQLAEAAGADGAHGVLRLFDAWRGLGGYVWYGRGVSEVSAGMELGSKYGPGKKPWPFTIYPRSGTVEVVFQHMASRPPFDSEELRREFWAQLTGIPGITIPADRLLRRPSFKLNILADSAVRDQVVEALRWFASVVEVRSDGLE